MPTHKPLISSSANGVSITRSGPKRSCKPSVARNTPPLTPTSSPRTRTLMSSCMARASAKLMASTSVTSGMGCALELVALGPIYIRKPGVEVVKHRVRCTWGICQVVLHRRLDALLAWGAELPLLELAPRPLCDKVGPQARDRFLLPMLLHLRWRAIAGRIARRRMIAKPIGKGFD